LAAIVKKHIITQLIEEGEGQHLDFKFEISDAAKIARSLVAFANTDGGKLLIGVVDDGSISGVNSEEELFMIEKASKKYCTPSVPFTSRRWNVAGKRVLSINVNSSSLAPHKAPNQVGKLMAYVRIDDKNMIANGVQMKIWRKQNTKSNVNIVYSEEVKQLLGYLRQTEPLSLNKIIEMMSLSRFKIENMLADLIVMKVVNMLVSVDTVLFSLADPEV
jgi:predicted HTH transcriptional regulator